MIDFEHWIFSTCYHIHIVHISERQQFHCLHKPKIYKAYILAYCPKIKSDLTHFLSFKLFLRKLRQSLCY